MSDKPKARTLRLRKSRSTKAKVLGSVSADRAHSRRETPGIINEPRQVRESSYRRNTRMGLNPTLIP